MPAISGKLLKRIRVAHDEAELEANRLLDAEVELKLQSALQEPNAALRHEKLAELLRAHSPVDYG